MKKIVYIILLYSVICNAQTSSFEVMIDSVLQKSVPFITSDDLLVTYEQYTILDTREITEYNVSHLKNAIHVGYDEFKVKDISKTLSKKYPLVVYCSIGYRSEKVAEKLIKKGYTVYNLYGGIFHWKNTKKTVIDSSGVSTNKVHCYNKEWSKWLTNGEKIYE